MRAPHAVRRVVGVVRTRGLLGVLRKARDVAADRRWDRRLGVETAAAVGPADMDLEGPNAMHASAPEMRGATVVYATPRITDLLTVLRSVPADRPRHLVDYGSGKGRVLLAARQVGYESAVGVELSAALCRDARANLAEVERRDPRLARGITVVEADASGFDVEAHHNVFYFYNPFGPPVLGPVLDRIVTSVAATPRAAWVIYVNHVHRDVFDAHDGLTVAADLSTPQYRSTLYRVTPAGVVPRPTATS